MSGEIVKGGNRDPINTMVPSRCRKGSKLSLIRGVSRKTEGNLVRIHDAVRGGSSPHHYSDHRRAFHSRSMTWKTAVTNFIVSASIFSPNRCCILSGCHRTRSSLSIVVGSSLQALELRKKRSISSFETFPALPEMTGQGMDSLTFDPVDCAVLCMFFNSSHLFKYLSQAATASDQCYYFASRFRRSATQQHQPPNRSISYT